MYFVKLNTPQGSARGLHHGAPLGLRRAAVTGSAHFFLKYTYFSRISITAASNCWTFAGMLSSSSFALARKSLKLSLIWRVMLRCASRASAISTTRSTFDPSWWPVSSDIGCDGSNTRGRSVLSSRTRPVSTRPLGRPESRASPCSSPSPCRRTPWHRPPPPPPSRDGRSSTQSSP